MIESTEQAISIVKNKQLAEVDREQGIYYLRDNPSNTSIRALVAALSDDDHGIRFAAAKALAFLGDAAMPALLEALTSPDNDVVLRNGARVVVTESSSPRVREQGQELLKAFKGSQAGIATMEAAFKLMPVFC